MERADASAALGQQKVIGSFSGGCDARHEEQWRDDTKARAHAHQVRQVVDARLTGALLLASGCATMPSSLPIHRPIQDCSQAGPLTNSAEGSLFKDIVFTVAERPAIPTGQQPSTNMLCNFRLS